ncbi:MAG: SDR family NAD(P)-dependent oxidoreductase [Burkholderiales bacterium]|nr:SDR family NAD(P)-dependent oxidoreductase [Burkholderiales bacterium]
MSSDFLDRIGRLSPSRLALLALEQHEKLQALATREPIAVVGLGCRFPGGADDPAAYWQLLVEGRDAIREVPPDRWDIDAWFDADADAPGRMSVRTGGFLDRVDGFDASFFGISPREAQTMDPQQRLMLEVVWEALEHAGIAPSSLAGSSTGVFVGVCNSDHSDRVVARGIDTIDAYLASGNAHSVVSGRVAYFLGLKGPALSIDTACSSSLVALHVAVQSLRAGEVRLALAGGVNVMCSPHTTVALTKAHMLAPDGRCKTFDAAADGFSRGEGCGALVLKRLRDARADGDRVLAVIRGSASNQDGRSGGLTVPSGPAQEAVIRAAVADAGLAPADISYVEAHGTGTRLGDPIEVRALGAALCAGRSADAPLLIGSAKTNFGHLESAAGVAGVIKVVLALYNEHIPPHLHLHEPSPHIDWQRHPVQVVTEGRTWARGAAMRRAGVSSFGFSGTNAHVVLEEAPPEDAGPTPHGREHDSERATVQAAIPLHVLPLSARTATARAALAQRYLDLLRDDVPLADLARSAGAGRSHFGERAAVVAADTATARAALQALVRGEEHEALHVGSLPAGQVGEFAFMYTGQGSQYPGMAMRLYALAPAFREVIDRCDALLGADASGCTLKAVLATEAGENDSAPIHDTSWTQPALFAVELALTEQWRRWGVVPAAAIGHSVGEYAAACAAGVFSLEQGLALIAERGRLMRALPAGGAMAALYATHEEVAPALAATAGRVVVAAYNADDSLVVAGAAAELDGVLARLATQNVQGQKLYVSLAAHSPWVEPALDALEAAAGRVAMHAPAIPVAWNVTGGALAPGVTAPDAGYWRRHLREPVRFAQGLRWLHGQGFTQFIEVGPHPTLSALAERSLPQARFIASMRRGKDDWQTLMHALAAAYVQGASIAWAEVAPRAARHAALPTYPFERQSYWLASSAPSAPQAPAAATPRAHAPAGSLRGVRLSTALPTFESVWRPDAPASLGQHRVHGAPLVAGPVFLEMAAAAARDTWGEAPRTLHDFEVHAPLVLPEAGRLVQLHFLPTGEEAVQRFEVHSRALVDGTAGSQPSAWTRHASGRVVVHDTSVPAGPTLGVAQLAKDMGAPASCAPHYGRLRQLGIDLGPAFAPMQVAHRREGEALVRMQLDDEAADTAPAAASAGSATALGSLALAEPGLLDGALQAVGLALPNHDDSGTVYLLAGLQSMQLAATPLPASMWARARLRPAESAQPAQWLADVTLHDDRGQWLGTLAGVALRRAARETLRRIVAQAAPDAGAPHSQSPAASLTYQVAWEDSPAWSRAAAHLVAPSAYGRELPAHFDRLAGEHGLAIYDDLLPGLDRMSQAYVAAALHRLGFADAPGRRFDPEAEARALGVVPAHRRLFGRLLQMLAEDGVLEAQGGAQYEVRRPLPTLEPARLAALGDELMARHAPVDGELSMLRRCGEHLAPVMRGEQDALQLLFPGGSFAEARKLYVESPYARTYNGALAAALRSATVALPPHARLRVLEIGAGTGGTTTYVLPLLDAQRTEYTFTDLSPLFLERAAETFAAYPFMQRRLLDIERDPVAQGLEAGRFDIVIAANVLHACADLGQAVAHARALLAPGGQLLLLEGVAPQRWVDLTFGLTDGWWRFADSALRPDYPLIATDTWRTLLARQGFDETRMLPEDGAGHAAAAQQAFIVARAAAPVRHWHLVGGPGPLVRALEQALHERGQRVSTSAHVDAVDAAAAAADEWVYLGALELTSPAPAGVPAVERCSELAVLAPLRGLATLARATSGHARAWLVSQGAQRLAGDAPIEPGRWMAPLWGLARVFALEHPARWGGVVDLAPGAAPAALAQQLLRTFEADDDEDQSAWRQGTRQVARLLHQPLPAIAAPALRQDATYLVTGGFGGLGLLLASWLADQGVRHLALLGRRPDDSAPALRALRERGVQVLALAGDVADEAMLDDLPQRLVCEQAPPLAGIFHLAADLNLSPIAALTETQVRAMLRPKIAGTVALQALARSLRLDLLVLFSTSTALLGAAGLAHYAAANAFLDATAEATADGPLTISVNWGTWEAMRLASADDQRSFQEAGLLPMRNADALAALGALLATRTPRAMVASVNWPQLKAMHEARRARPFLRRVGQQESPRQDDGSSAAPVAAPASAAGGAAAEALMRRLQAAPAAARRDVLVEFVQREVAAVLALPNGHDVALGTGLFDLGMDSLMAVELKRRLERGAGKALPSTLTFNYPNVGALAGFLESMLAATLAGGATAAAPVALAAATPAITAADTPAAPQDIGAMSEDELEQQLLARLERLS